MTMSALDLLGHQGFYPPKSMTFVSGKESIGPHDAQAQMKNQNNASSIWTHVSFTLKTCIFYEFNFKHWNMDCV